MRTDQLVTALVADSGHLGWRIGRLVALAGLGGAALSLVVFFAELGPRQDLAAAVTTWRFDLKLLLVAAFCAAAFAACRAMALPLASRGWGRPALLAALLAAAALAVELVVSSPGDWRGRLVGTNSMVCLTTIPLLAVGPLAALLIGLRRAAPASPVLAGAAAGAFASAIAAAIYAFHCFDDSPLFVLTWYPLAVSLVVAAGALIGQRILRW